MWNLNNKTVVISGATNGIGKAAAIEISRENPKLLFTYRNPVSYTHLTLPTIYSV